jgi:hypothetical protein
MTISKYSPVGYFQRLKEFVRLKECSRQQCLSNSDANGNKYELSSLHAQSSDVAEVSFFQVDPSMGQCCGLPTASAKPVNMNNTILVLPLQSLASYEHFGPWIDQATSKTQQRLLVFLVSPLFNSQSDLNPTESWKAMEKLLSFIYTRSSQIAMKEERVLMRVDVIFQGDNGHILSGLDKTSTLDWDALFAPSHGTQMASRPPAF